MGKIDVVGGILKIVNEELDLTRLRMTRIPSKRKKKTRREYAKKHSTRCV